MTDEYEILAISGNKMNTPMLKHAFVPVLLLLAACTATPVGTEQPVPTAAPATQALPPTDTPSPTQDSGRYTNTEGGFSLKLPEGWSALGPVETSNPGQAPYNIYILGVDPSPEGGPGSSKIAIMDAGVWTAEQFVLSQCSTCDEHPFEDLTLGGQPARRTQIGGGGVPFTVTWWFIEKDGKLIGLAIHDPETLEPLDEVVQSIQFQ
jgi:hypothetical protein